jgi:hypothetical protein
VNLKEDGSNLEPIKIYTNDVITVENIKIAVKKFLWGGDPPPQPPFIFLSFF